MQKLVLKHTQQQKLSPQQIQFIKLLQIPTSELSQRIEEELEINPALEEGKNQEYEEHYGDEEDRRNDGDEDVETFDPDNLDISSYENSDDYGGSRLSDNYGTEDRREGPAVISGENLHDMMIRQAGFLGLNEKEDIIARQIIGSIEDDGYLRRPLRSISNDLAFTQNVYASENEIESVLKKIQKFEPSGIGARDLRECLLLQIEKTPNSKDYATAHTILKDYFEEFSKKHFEKIQKKMNLDEEELRNAFQIITRLNPKPGNQISGSSHETVYLIPDFIVTKLNGVLEVFLNSKNAPDLQISKSFSDMLDTYAKGGDKDKNIKETVIFVKQKLDAARWFIDAIKQRQQTLLKTMRAIVKFQNDFFNEGNENKLRPMILKDIAEIIDMDISTVSRVANSKSVQTDFGIYPLKYFFSEGIATDTGEDASSREVKSVLQEIVDSEPKDSPYSDDRIEKIMKEKGFRIARRTVAKYREQLGIPIARLRKEI